MEGASLMAWETLLGIVEEAKQQDREDETGTPTSCPNDHTALRQGPDGKLYCPWDGLVWPDDASAWGPYPGSY